MEVGSLLVERLHVGGADPLHVARTVSTVDDITTRFTDDVRAELAKSNFVCTDLSRYVY